MEKRYVKRKVDLQLLGDTLADFLAKKGFKLTSDKLDREYRIIGVPRSHHDILEEVRVVIEGDENDFVVKFISGDRSHSFVMYGFLTTLFGGGSFLLQGLKSEERLERLETEFWAYVEMVIDHLGV